MLTSSMTLLLSSLLLLLLLLLPFAGHAASFDRRGVSIERAKTSGSPRASTSTLLSRMPPPTPKPVHELLFVGHDDLQRHGSCPCLTK